MFYLFLGYGLIWLGLFLYLLQMSLRQKKLEQELRLLEEASRASRQ